MIASGKTIHSAYNCWSGEKDRYHVAARNVDGDYKHIVQTSFNLMGVGWFAWCLEILDCRGQNQSGTGG